MKTFMLWFIMAMTFLTIDLLRWNLFPKTRQECLFEIKGHFPHSKVYSTDGTNGYYFFVIDTGYMMYHKRSIDYWMIQMNIGLINETNKQLLQEQVLETETIKDL
jgi:hypothetical protein